MAISTSGSSNSGFQTIATGAIQSGGQYALTIPSVVGFTPNDVGYYWLFIQAATSSTFGYVAAKGIIYSPGSYLYLPTANIAGFGAFTLIAKWKRNALGWTFISQ